jgi:hypothetical protein
MDSPSERVEALMNEFRRDAFGWKLELARLKADGHNDLVAMIDGWTREAERVLARWGS